MKCVIVANGEINDDDFARLIFGDCDVIIACDGGLKHCHRLGITPDYIVGDLDSAPKDILDRYQDVPMLRFSPEKDQTDLELGVALACDIMNSMRNGPDRAAPKNAKQAFSGGFAATGRTDFELIHYKGADSIVILGGLGGRFDHQLANAHVLAQAVEHGVNAELCDEYTRIRLINNCCRLHKQEGLLVTLVPLTTTVDGIVTEGLQYPLKDESLSVGFARGVSNQIIGEQALVSIKSGLLFVIQIKVGQSEFS